MSRPAAPVAADPRVARYEACEREVLHAPGSIQPQAALLAVDTASGCIEQLSLNTAEVLGHGPEALRGEPLAKLTGDDLAAHLLAGELEAAYPNLRMPHLLAVTGADGQRRELVLTAHRESAAIILELERHEPQYLDPVLDYHRLLAALSRLAQAGSESELLQQAVVEVQGLTGYERVMYYRFEPDGTGVVTHEALASASVTSYLHHRFPAADIPERARELYRKNPLRFIFDARAAPVAIAPPVSPGSGAPLDLTYADFRSVAPVHIEYLRNMGVRASLSLSVVIDQGLAGLIVCHHGEAKSVSLHSRGACRSLSVMLSSHVARLRASEESQWEIEARQALEGLSEAVVRGRRFATAFRHHTPELLALLEADSVFLQFGAERIAAPKAAAKLAFPERLGEACAQGGVFASEQLGALCDLDAAQRELVTGGIFIGLDNADFLCLGRREHLETLVWGGDPDKPVGEGAGAAGALSPRASFASWRETVRGKSAAFGRREHAIAAAIRNVLMELRALEFRRLAEQQLRMEATTDSLTGLANRKELHRRGEEELARARRHGRELALVYFDLDHFKAINDTLGHDCGDRVLQTVAAICHDRLRKSDTGGRLGGEELALLLPETGLEAAIALAEQLRAQLEASVLDYEGTAVRFTASFGVAACAPGADDSFEDLLKRADAALYQAKDTGRNRVARG